MATDVPVQSSITAEARDAQDPPEDRSRMSFGDHLDELRNALIRTLIGVAVSAGFCLIFGKVILRFICLPLWRVQYANGLPPQLQVLSPTAAFTAYLKIALLAGLILSMPWVIHQAWSFISSGLYANERRFARLFVPTASGLFVIGVLFVYYVVLPIVLQFFITFNESFQTADLSPTAFQQLLLSEPEHPRSVHTTHPLLKLPLRSEDPEHPENGDTWINETTRTFMIQTPAGILSTPLDISPARSPMQSQFAIDFYISFVLTFALGFGLAFETPIVVFFLARTGIASVGTMQRARRFVVLACVVVGAVLTPPDVISQMLLAVPMYALFEIGLFAARVAERKAAANASGP